MEVKGRCCIRSRHHRNAEYRPGNGRTKHSRHPPGPVECVRTGAGGVGRHRPDRQICGAEPLKSLNATPRSSWRRQDGGNTVGGSPQATCTKLTQWLRSRNAERAWSGHRPDRVSQLLGPSGRSRSTGPKSDTAASRSSDSRGPVHLGSTPGWAVSASARQLRQVGPDVPRPGGLQRHGVDGVRVGSRKGDAFLASGYTHEYKVESNGTTVVRTSSSPTTLLLSGRMCTWPNRCGSQARTGPVWLV